MNKVEVRARESELRCAFCHDGGGEFSACERCGVECHEECWKCLSRCPTLGCEADQESTSDARQAEEDEWNRVWHARVRASFSLGESPALDAVVDWLCELKWAPFVVGFALILWGATLFGNWLGARQAKDEADARRAPATASLDAGPAGSGVVLSNGDLAWVKEKPSLHFPTDVDVPPKSKTGRYEVVPVTVSEDPFPSGCAPLKLVAGARADGLLIGSSSAGSAGTTLLCSWGDVAVQNDGTAEVTRYELPADRSTLDGEFQWSASGNTALDAQVASSESRWLAVCKDGVVTAVLSRASPERTLCSSGSLDARASVVVSGRSLVFRVWVKSTLPEVKLSARGRVLVR